MKTMELFKTSDIILAAFLKAKKYKLTDVEISGVKGTFVFDSVDESVLKNYDYGNALVEPKEFNKEIKALTTASRRNMTRSRNQ